MLKMENPSSTLVNSVVELVSTIPFPIIVLLQYIVTNNEKDLVMEQHSLSSKMSAAAP